MRRTDGGITVVTQQPSCEVRISGLAPDGAPDRRFASGALLSGCGDAQAAAGPGGRTVVATGSGLAPGQATYVMVLDRHGRYDRAFSGDGGIRISSARHGLTPAAVFAGPGRIVVAWLRNRYLGPQVDPIPCEGMLVRAFTLAGRPDAGFGQGGTVRLPSCTSLIARDPAGRLVFLVNAGGDDPAAWPRTFAVTRLTRAGHHDQSFGSDGSLVFQLPGPALYWSPVRIFAPTLHSILLAGRVGVQAANGTTTFPFAARLAGS